MKRTIRMLIPSLSLESISLIEVRHKLVLKKHGTKTGKVVPPKEQVPEVILAPVVKEEAGKNVPSVAKPQQKKRDASYGLRRYLSLILDLEGFSFERDVKTKPLDGYYNFCTDNEDVSDLILHASAWYCHNTKAVTIMKEKEVFCVVVDLDVKKPALKVWEKFNFCPPPKRGELMAKTYSRIVRILRDNKNVDLSRIHDGLFQLTFRNKKSPFLQRAMSEMQWEIYPGVSPFITKINTEMKDTMSSNFETEPVVKKEEVVAPADNVVISEVKKEEVQPKDVVVAEQELTREMLRLFKDKEDAVSQLESFVGSQEFETLTPELQTELKNIWIKSVKEDPKRFARFLIDYLK